MDIRGSCTTIDQSKRSQTIKQFRELAAETAEVLSGLPEHTAISWVSYSPYSGASIRVDWDFFHEYFDGLDVCEEKDKRSNGFVMHKLSVFVGRVKIEAEKYEKIELKKKRLAKAQ